jgi:predicted dehydrogenase
MKILIAGLGSIGRRHLRNLQALGESDILLYRTGRSSLPDDELAGLPVETDLSAALAQHPRAAIISNPTALHLEAAIPAAEAGCHVLIEKPLSHSLERLDELQAAVRRGGGQVLVGYHFRYHPGLHKAAELLECGAIGEPLSARAHWGEYLPGWHPWEDYRQAYSARPDLGGGVILTLSHPLDYLRWLLGEVAAVWAFTGQQGGLDLPVEDTAEIGLQFRSGVLGSVHLDYNQRPSAHTLEVIGSRGVLQWDNRSGAVSLFRADEAEQTSESREMFPAPPGFERNDLFLAEMRHFLTVARGETAPVCTLEDGVAALRLALAAHRSAHEGKLVEL